MFSEYIQSRIRFLSNALKIRDSFGVKRGDVYFYRKKESESEPTYTKFDPSPIIERVDDNFDLEPGGLVDQVDIRLRGFPKSLFNREDLETSTEEGNEARYFIIENFAYTIKRIRENVMSYDVDLIRTVSANKIEIPDE